jgi:hypothetical protein
LHSQACALLFDHSNCRDLKREVPEGYTGLSFRDRNDVESILVKKGCTLIGYDEAHAVLERYYDLRAQYPIGSTLAQVRGASHVSKSGATPTLFFRCDVGSVLALLTPAGVVTMEFPHLLRLIEGNQFDTIYHEHYSYLSLGTVARIAAVVGLNVVDVEKLPTHGGSLRVWLAHQGTTGVAKLHRIRLLKSTRTKIF